ncbi:hypothetical protein GBF38_010517 [Nibea albiflora]|uniref:Uncharacterized protein n=1 Tax=Nibea albiflora TaxID=240163 RepID=A0ACB7F4A7_NIBAL|nr:hypothetical protein GBF38_010517 [Nibea albiflora]
MAVTTDIAIATSAQVSFTRYAQRWRNVCGSCESASEESSAWRSEACFQRVTKEVQGFPFSLVFGRRPVNLPSRHKLFRCERPVLGPNAARLSDHSRSMESKDAGRRRRDVSVKE